MNIQSRQFEKPRQPLALKTARSAWRCAHRAVQTSTLGGLKSRSESAYVEETSGCALLNGRSFHLRSAEPNHDFIYLALSFNSDSSERIFNRMVDLGCNPFDQVAYVVDQ